MLRKIIRIPEGAYYRGRFRATTAWSKASMREGEGDSVLASEEGAHRIDDLDRPLLERVIPGRTRTKALQMRPAEP
jgi:hypothetical protein